MQDLPFLISKKDGPSRAPRNVRRRMELFPYLAGNICFRIRRPKSCMCVSATQQPEIRQNSVRFPVPKVKVVRVKGTTLFYCQRPKNIATRSQFFAFPSILTEWRRRKRLSCRLAPGGRQKGVKLPLSFACYVDVSVTNLSIWLKF